MSRHHDERAPDISRLPIPVPLRRRWARPRAHQDPGWLSSRLAARRIRRGTITLSRSYPAPPSVITERLHALLTGTGARDVATLAGSHQVVYRDRYVTSYDVGHFWTATIAESPSTAPGQPGGTAVTLVGHPLRPNPWSRTLGMTNGMATLEILSGKPTTHPRAIKVHPSLEALTRNAILRAELDHTVSRHTGENPVN